MVVCGRATMLRYSRPKSVAGRPGNGKDESAQLLYRSVFELATAKHHARLKKMFDIRSEVSKCTMGDALSEKYGLECENQQLVVSITNRHSFEQTWYNEARKRKPQMFVQANDIIDPTQGGKSCDFCDWKNMTAVDEVGRIELPGVVTTSNLFKCCAPFHGLIIFKKHHPLDFNQEDVFDMLNAAQEWVSRAQNIQTDASHSLLIWNCLPRSGGSQFHGHAQIMLSKVPFPAEEQLRRTVQMFAPLEENKDYVKSLLDAYQDIGLLRDLSSESERCYIYPSITPIQDMEIVIWGQSVTSKPFQVALYSVLRILIKSLGMTSFNVGIQGIQAQGGGQSTSWWGKSIGQVQARVVSRGPPTKVASDYGGYEVFGGTSIGATDPCLIASVLDKHFEDLKMG